MPNTQPDSFSTGVLLAAAAVIANQAATRWFFTQQEKKSAEQHRTAVLEAQVQQANQTIPQLVAEVQRLQEVEQRFKALTGKPRTAKTDKPLNISDFPSEHDPEPEA